MNTKLTLRFILQTTYRLKSRLVAMALTLTLGLMGLLFLNIVSNSFKASLDGKAKQLLSSDLAVGARRYLSDDEIKSLASVMSGKFSQMSQTVEMFSMLRSQNQKTTRLVEVVAIDELYPIYGYIDLKSSGRIQASATKRLISDESWISQDLTYDFDMNIYIGNKLFQIDDVVIDASTMSWRGVGLAPRVYVPLSSLQETGLIAHGSTLYQRFHYKLNDEWLDPSKREELKKEILKKLTDPAINVKTPEESSEQVSRIIRYLVDYLGLVSLAALFLSAVGCVYLFRGHLFSMMKSIAVFRVLGITPRQINLMFMVQLLTVSLLASFFSLMLAAILFPTLEVLLSNLLQTTMALQLNTNSVISILVISILVGTLSCYPQIEHYSAFKLTALLADDDQYNRGHFKKLLLQYIPAVVIFYLLSVWLAHSFVMGSVFFGLFVLSGMIFFISVNVVMKILDRIVTARRDVLNNMAILSLVRNPHTTTLSFVSLGLGVLLLSIISLIEVGVHSELDYNDESDIPELFMFDVQEEQVEGVKKILAEHNVLLLQSSPLVRARLSKINGEAFKRRTETEFETREDENSRRFSNRGINLTYSDKLNSSETLIDGEFPATPKDSNIEAAVSLEQRYAQRLGVKLGDSIEFDILGVPVTTVVTSFRKVKWTSFLPNFFVLFSGDALVAAPKTYLMAVKSKQLPRSELQAILVRAYPNISCIDVVVATKKIIQIFSQMALALKMMAIFCLMVGGVVLYAIARDMIIRRQGQIALLKMLGLSMREIFMMTLKEFFVLCYSSIFLGIAVSYGIVAILLEMFFDGGIVFDPYSLIFLTVIIPFLIFILLSHLISKVMRKSTIHSLVLNT